MYSVLHKTGFGLWQVNNIDEKEKAVELYATKVLLHGLDNVRFLQDVDDLDEIIADLTMKIENLIGKDSAKLKLGTRR